MKPTNFSPSQRTRLENVGKSYFPDLLAAVYFRIVKKVAIILVASKFWQ